MPNVLAPEDRGTTRTPDSPFRTVPRRERRWSVPAQPIAPPSTTSPTQPGTTRPERPNPVETDQRPETPSNVTIEGQRTSSEQTLLQRLRAWRHRRTHRYDWYGQGAILVPSREFGRVKLVMTGDPKTDRLMVLAHNLNTEALHRQVPYVAVKQLCRLQKWWLNTDLSKIPMP